MSKTTEWRNTKLGRNLQNGKRQNVENYQKAKNIQNGEYTIYDSAVADTFPKYLPTTHWQKLQNDKNYNTAKITQLRITKPNLRPSPIRSPPPCIPNLT